MGRNEFMQGFCLAVGIVASSNSDLALLAINEAGYCWQDFLDAEVDEFDLQNLECIKEMLE